MAAAVDSSVCDGRRRSGIIAPLADARAAKGVPDLRDA
jgi:hypothetical protein